jgi:broad specificity phosphatase PhoE
MSENDNREKAHMELYLIRHGQSHNNALSDQKARIQDPPLTDLGQRQAALLADYLADGRNRDPWVDHTTGYSVHDQTDSFGITHLYVSPMLRALQTAAPVARALGLQPEVWVNIHEHGGIYLERDGVVTGFPGMTRSEILARFPEYRLGPDVTEHGWYDPARGHETFAGAYGRALAVAFDLRKRAQDEANRGQRLVLITHGTFLDALLKAFFNQLPSRHLYYLHYNTGITRIDFLDRERMLVRFINRGAHLPRELLS